MSHWILTVSVITLAVSGTFILMVHPRLYWGETGNDLMPVFLELPISRNHQHGGWEGQMSISESSPEIVSASRTFAIFNQNGWGRSLHFLAAWLLVVPGAAYLWLGLTRGHFRWHVMPKKDDLTKDELLRDVTNHLRFRIRPPTGGPQYGVLQKCTYSFVIFFVAPVVVVSGLAMSPAITAALPFLLDLFGGFQSARTIHFFAFVVLVLFVVIHVVMVMRSGFKRQIRGMTIGE